MSNSLQPHGLYSPWNSPGQNTGVGNLSLLQEIFLTQESNQGILHCRWILYQLSYQGSPFSCVQLFVIPWTVTFQAPLSMGFPRQEYWSGLPFPSAWDLPHPGTEPRRLHCRQVFYQLSHQGSPVSWSGSERLQVPARHGVLRDVQDVEW